MFTEYEVDLMIRNETVLQSIQQIKKEFCKTVAPYLEISDHDFLSLLFLTPTLGIALANENISLKEELDLNKKARKLSKGRYFFKKDPVVVAMQFMIKHYKEWEDRFIEVLKKVMNQFFDPEKVNVAIEAEDVQQYRRQVLHSPYILIRFIAAFFLEQDDHAFSGKSLSQVEYNKLLELGEKLGLSEMAVFKSFCQFTLHVK